MGKAFFKQGISATARTIEGSYSRAYQGVSRSIQRVTTENDSKRISGGIKVKVQLRFL